jgi:hypothetical protein
MMDECQFIVDSIIMLREGSRTRPDSTDFRGRKTPDGGAEENADVASCYFFEEVELARPS